MGTTLAETLRTARRQHKLSLIQVSAETDIDVAYLSRLETGKRTNPRWDVIRRLRDVLDIDLQEVE